MTPLIYLKKNNESNFSENDKVTEMLTSGITDMSSSSMEIRCNDSKKMQGSKRIDECKLKDMCHCNYDSKNTIR